MHRVQSSVRPSVASTPLGEHLQVVRVWIQRAIYDNTALDNVASEDSNRLIKYLEDPVTRDLCYRELMNRALDDKTKDPRVLGKVVSLLRKYLPRYPPAHDTLLYLDHLPSASLDVRGEGPSQSLMFVRSLVQRRMLDSTESISSAMSRESQRSISRAAAFGGSFDTPVALIPNFWMLARLADQAHSKQPSQTGQEQSTSSTPNTPDVAKGRSYFEIASEQLTESGDLFQSTADQLGIDVFANPMCDRIAVVADFKLQTGLKAARQSDHLQKKRPVPKSVPYDKQTPLKLLESEMRKLVYVVMTEDACGKERHMMATKVLIKVLMDGFVLMAPDLAAKQVLVTMFRMLGRDDSRARGHALNVLLNLCVHANLITTNSVFQQTGKTGSKMSRGTTRGTVDLSKEQQQAASEANTKVAIVLDALWTVTKETVLRLFYLSEDSPIVWASVLNLLLYQTAEHGKINFQRLSNVDVRVFRCICQNAEPLGDEQVRLSVSVLCNVLSEISVDRRTAFVESARFQQAQWPIHQVIDLYVNARSAEVVCNSFFLIYHHIVGKLQSAAPPNSQSRIIEQAQTLNAVLVSLGTPWVFQKVFLFPLTQDEARNLSGIISSVKSQSKAKGMTMRNTKVKRQNNKLLNQLDSQFVSDFFTALLKEGSDYLGLDPELEAYKERMLTHPKSLRNLLDTLEELLFSPWALDRHYGQNWLTDLFVVMMEDNPAGASTAPVSPVSFGAGRGGKGRGKPGNPVPPKVPAVPGLGNGVGGGGGGVNPAPAPGGAGAAVVKGVSKEARQLLALKSPRRDGPTGSETLKRSSPREMPPGPGAGAAVGGNVPVKVKLPGTAPPAASSGSESESSVESPRVPQLQLPFTPQNRLQLAGSTPQEIATSFQKMKTLVTETHEKLLASPSAVVRRSYLQVSKRLLSYIRSRYGATDPERAISTSVDLINTYCSNLGSRNETDPIVLMQMFDIIFDFISSDPCAETTGATGETSSEKSGAGLDSARDTNYMHFLSGKRMVSLTLLARLDSKPLKMLFDVLPPAYESVRVVVLILIAALCSDKVEEDRAKKTFAEVGGLAWFKNHLDDPNPQIAFHASRFLSEYLQAQDPQQYSLALKKLIAIIPEDKIAIDFFHVLALLGDSTYLTIGKGPRKVQ